MKTETLHPAADYIQESVNFITRKEGWESGLPYFDSASAADFCVVLSFFP